jgi:cytochrome c oxidase cbb3-type subunit 3
MKDLKRIFGLCVVLFVAVLFHLLAQGQGSGQGAAGGKKAKAGAPQKKNFLISRPVPSPEAVERGQKLFVTQCGFCHGARATGGESGPDLVRSVVALRDEQGELIGPIIRKGSADKKMPPFNMTDAQVKDIASFLRERQQAAINRGAYPLQNLVTGDAKRGEAYFTGAGGCVKCHSVSGDLKGIGTRYTPANLLPRFLYPGPARFGPQPGDKPPAPTMVTVTPSNGQAVSGTLEQLDDFTVALRDGAGYYRSFARTDGLKLDVRDPIAAHEALLSKYTDADMHDLLTYLVTLK